MRVKQQTIDQLAAQGITIKIFPTSREAYFERCYAQRYDWLKPWFCGLFKGFDENGKDILIDRPDEERQAEARKYAEKDCNNWWDAETLYIAYGDNRLICKKWPVKSKEVTYDYVIKAVEQDKKLYEGPYGYFTDKFRKLMPEELKENINVHPHLYGIGVWVFWNYQASKHIAAVEETLKKYDIEYTTEFSPARWVYRFKISKKASNLNKI